MVNTVKNNPKQVKNVQKTGQKLSKSSINGQCERRKKRFQKVKNNQKQFKTEKNWQYGQKHSKQSKTVEQL